MLNETLDTPTTPSASARQSPLADDIFTFQHVTKKDTLDFELGLFQTKWFDYRMLTTLEATWQFVRDYETVYREFYAQMLDRERANFVQPQDEVKLREGLAAGLSKAKRYFSSCWRARQVADAIGIPYKQYIRLTMDARLRNWQRNTLPQPGQLYTDYVVEMALKRWEEIKKSRIFFAEHKAFQAQNYMGISYQDDYHEYLMAQAKERPHESDILADLIKNGSLPYEKVMSRLSDEMREKVANRM